MIIRKNGHNLVTAGLVKVKRQDQWSVTLDVVGLDPETGDQTHYDVVVSLNEIAFLNRAARQALKEGA